MTEQLNYVIFNTNLGWVGILSSVKGVVRLTLPCPSAQEARQRLLTSTNHVAESPRLFEDLVARLRLYFHGHQVTFPDPLDLSGATVFQRRVWETTQLIPNGETRSYAWVAEQIGQVKAVRAVGQALSQNPLPILVPCHRVLTSHGKLGGFSGGLEMKKRLLQLESPASVR